MQVIPLHFSKLVQSSCSVIMRFHFVRGFGFNTDILIVSERATFNLCCHHHIFNPLLPICGGGGGNTEVPQQLVVVAEYS